MADSGAGTRASASLRWPLPPRTGSRERRASSWTYLLPRPWLSPGHKGPLNTLQQENGLGSRRRTESSPRTPTSPEAVGHGRGDDAPTSPITTSDRNFLRQHWRRYCEQPGQRVARRLCHPPFIRLLVCLCPQHDLQLPASSRPVSATPPLQHRLPHLTQTKTHRDPSRPSLALVLVSLFGAPPPPGCPLG